MLNLAAAVEFVAANSNKFKELYKLPDIAEMTVQAWQKFAKLLPKGT